ncbi:MAG: AI-2E family transporter [Oscillospiraceae bacterium]
MKIEWKTCLKIGVSIFALYLCIYYWPTAAHFIAVLLGAAYPLFLGFAFAYIVNILMSFYERHYFPGKTEGFAAKSRRTVCMLGSFLTAIAIIALIIGLVVPQFVSCIKTIFDLLPGAIESIVDLAEEYNLISGNYAELLSSIDWQSKIEQIIQAFTSGLGSFMSTVVQTVSSVASTVVTYIMGLIFAIYLLLDKDRLSAQGNRIIHHYLKPALCEKIHYVLSVLNDSFHRFIVGQCTEAVILGVLCTIGMLILRLPYATMIGALIAFTALIPVAGAWIGGGIGAFMILTESPIKALIFIIFIVILQNLENNFIYPHVVGSSIGLPGIWVLAAVTVGGGLMGVFGMLLGVPIVSALYRILREDMDGTGNLRMPKKTETES